MIAFPLAGALVKSLSGPLKLVLFSLIVLLAILLNQWMAAAFNSVVTADGRVWNQRHTAWGLAMQTYTALAIMLLFGCDAFIIGYWTAPWIGWLTFFGLIVPCALAVWVYARSLRPWLRSRRQGALDSRDL